MDNGEKIQGFLTTLKGTFIYEYSFFHNSTYHFDSWALMIWDDKDKDSKRKADMNLLIMEDGRRLKVIDMFMNDYAGKGIAIGMIRKAKELFGKEIISSSNKVKSFTGEGNWEEAIERVWDPLVKQCLAVYDATNDHYILL